MIRFPSLARRLLVDRFHGGRRLLFLVLILLLAMGCSAPPDRGLTRPQAVPATRFAQHDITVDGLRLRYIDVAASEPQEPRLPLLLLHGHTSRIEEYDELAAELSRRQRVLVFDLPGSGYSDKPVRDYDLAFYEHIALGFLDRLGVERANLGGGSQGGNLVLRLAYREPRRFERIAAWAPGSAWPARPWLAGLMRAVAGYPLFWPIVKVQSRYWYRPDWPLRETLLTRTFTYYDEVMGDGFVRMYFGMAADQVGRTLFDLAPAVQPPVLLMWGDQDFGGGMDVGVQRLHRELPHNELRVFAHAGHALASEVPGPLAAAIEEFLARPRERLP